MEMMVKKFQQKFRRVREEMGQWDQLQSRLISQFRNASSIIERLQLIDDPKNYGSLKNLGGVKDAIVEKQMESLQTIMFSMYKTLEELNGIVISLGKILRDGRQQVKVGSVQPTMKQLQQRIGIKPSLADCLEGLQLLQEMHQAEYLLKSSAVSALATLTLKPSVSDLCALQQLLVDQPNIPKEEVQSIFDIIFAEETVEYPVESVMQNRAFWFGQTNHSFIWFSTLVRNYPIIYNFPSVLKYVSST